MLTLDGVDQGRYIVTTLSGTRHLLDLNEKTVTRYAAPGHEWDGSEGAGRDGEPFRYLTLEHATVGMCMFIQNLGAWRRTSTIQSIEYAADDF